MHYSQMRRQSGSNRKSMHPGTPRPISENVSSNTTNTSSRSRHSVTDASHGSNPALEHPCNLHNQSRKQPRQNCGLPKYQQQQYQAKGANNQDPATSPDKLPTYLVWVKNEPFDFGILSSLPCPKIGINILRKIAEYCREKPNHFPELSLNQWNHICKYKIQLATDLGFTYFRVFDVLTRASSTWIQHSQEKTPRHASKEKEDNCSTEIGGESWDAKFNKVVKHGVDYSDDFKVDTMQFLLFIYIQHFLRLHKKYYMKSYGDDPWPKAWANNLQQRSTGIGANAPEQQQTEFIVANLADMIDFLMILVGKKQVVTVQGAAVNPDSDEQSSEQNLRHQQYQRIPLEVIKALTLLLGVACNMPNPEFKDLDECLHLPNVRWKLEYSRYSRTVDRKCLIQWIMQNLRVNPWGPSGVLIPQAGLAVMTGVWKDVDCFKQNKIFWNTQGVPRMWYLISGVDNQVLVIDSLAPMSSVKVHRCTSAFIYLPGCYSYVMIQKCHGITLNLGAAAKVVKIVDCSNITVSAVGRQFLISDVSCSTFYLMTPSSPVVCGSKNHEIRVAPYNTSYPTLASDMRASGISTKIQRWNKPIEIANDGSPRAFQQSNVLPLDPEKFILLRFPFKPTGSATNVSTTFKPPLPGTLSTLYQRQLDQPALKMELARKEFCAKLMHSDENSSLIYQITLLRFKRWLKENYHYNHILGLRSLQKSLEHERSLPVLCSKGHDLKCVAKAMKNFFRADAPHNTVSSSASVRSSPSVSSSNRSSHSKNRDQARKAEKSEEPYIVTKKVSKMQESGAGDEGIDELQASPCKYPLFKMSSSSFKNRDVKEDGDPFL